MTKEQIKASAEEKVRQVIDLIAERKFDKLTEVTRIEESWCKDPDTGEMKDQAYGMAEFGEWLTGQLKLWEEYEEREFVSDPFDRKFLRLDDDDIDPEGVTFAVYSPSNHGEQIHEFWYEFTFRVKDDVLCPEFNINV